MILSSLFATVGMMTYFGWVYYYKYTGVNATGAPTNFGTKQSNTGTKNDSPIDNINNRLVRWVIWSNFSLNMLYVINIMTNQGKLTIMHYQFVYVLIVLFLASQEVESGFSATHFESLLDFG